MLGAFTVWFGYILGKRTKVLFVLDHNLNTISNPVQLLIDWIGLIMCFLFSKVNNTYYLIHIIKSTYSMY